MLYAVEFNLTPILLISALYTVVASHIFGTKMKHINVMLKEDKCKL